MPLLTPPRISSGGIIPEEPPPFSVRPRGSSYGPGVTAKFQPAAEGAGRAVLERMQEQPGPAVSLDDISASGLAGRVRAKRQLDELYEGEGGYDPKLATLEEGQKDLAIGAQQEQQELAMPASGPRAAPRPAQRWRDQIQTERSGQERLRLRGELDTIGRQAEEMAQNLQQEVMASPEYAVADDETKQTLLARAQSQAQQHALDLERRILAVGSLSAGKGLPTTAFPRP